ncbi:MAG TPA: M14 family zinc carboxypeptidase [Candidatus Polarisedimenticolaceae bacterium]|nr:M14 family zinc carboxypeptidase [Candidatus Polarisedimenticolaceae bacterium]
MNGKIVVTLILAAILAAPALALDSAGYLPDDADHDPDLPPPESFLGFEVGRRHLRHDQLVGYLELLAERSPRLAIERTGTTHEGRPLLLLTVSSPANLARLDGIARGRADGSTGGPLVVWHGFSVHGDEASGSNAALLLAYHLAAARDAATTRLLDRTVVLIDPSLNPDGMARFAQWSASHWAHAPSADPAARAHHEAWPGGRTNHYWFDLNRDWLLLVHPESRARVARFHHWRPHVLTDFHEMGSDATYFFQPGVPSRMHPLTPERNIELTREIGSYHAAALENLGQLYFTEEVFDDYYYGKGSTYPDVNGAIGILFEQASSRGQRIDTPHGQLDFETTVRNQLATALSTLRAADDLRDELIAYQAAFYDDAAERARQDPVGAYVIGDAGDPARAYHLVELLLRHQIEVYELARELTVAGRSFAPNAAWVVPTAQRQYLLVHAMMERRTEFLDQTFYDVSAWTLPLSFNLPVATLGRSRVGGATGARVRDVAFPAGAFVPDGAAYAHAFDWSGYYAPRALERLLASERRVYVATKPFTAETSTGRHRFDRGSIVIPAASNGGVGALEELLSSVAERDGIDVRVLSGGLTVEGVDLGSPSLRRLEPVRPLLVVGPGASAYEAGQVWHLLDTRVGLPLTMVDGFRLDQVNLAEFSELILVDGDYAKLGDEVVERVRGWIRGGGHLIAIKRAARWAVDGGLFARPADEDGEDEAQDDDAQEDEPDAEPAAEEKSRRYDDFRDDRARRRIAGSIFAVELDATHPVGFGYEPGRLPVFRNETVIVEPSDNPYENVAIYAADPLLSGYVGEERLAELAGSAAIVARRIGRGSVVLMADDPNFRGIWYGTNRLFINAVYFSQIIDETELDD